MSNPIYTIITGTGSFIPSNIVKNEAFLKNEFTESNGKPIEKDNQEIIDKFFEITAIAERRYADDKDVTSDMAYYAAVDALESSGTDPETLDYIIVGHNFGDVLADNRKTDMVPSLAARVKYRLGIENPDTIAYDVIFGCPGWLQGFIQADYFIKSGDAKKILVIGADTLSRISDPHDRDSMLYADGAGAVILEGKSSSQPLGVLSHRTRSDTLQYSKMLYMGPSFREDDAYDQELFLKMNGRRLYQYALERVPMAIKAALDKAGLHLNQVKKVLIHQANGKMDDEILRRLYNLYNIDMPEDVLPMTISWLGNTSVATVPTLLDLIMKGKMEPHQINKGDYVVFASVGAGMNINALVYKSL